MLDQDIIIMYIFAPVFALFIFLIVKMFTLFKW